MKQRSLIFILILIGLGVVYFANKKTQSPCVTARNEIIALVNHFETLQVNKDAKGVLNLFTPPVSQKDIQQYSNLSTQFSPNQYRLYGTLSWGGGKETGFQTTNPPIANNDGSCTIYVMEQISGYSNAYEYVGYLPAKPITTTFNIVKQNGIWKIEKYYTSEQTDKYSAWGRY